MVHDTFMSSKNTYFIAAIFILYRKCRIHDICLMIHEDEKINVNDTKAAYVLGQVYRIDSGAPGPKQ